MTKINKSQIEHIASLSKLNLSEEEKNRFSGDLTHILNYVEQLSAVNTDNVIPLANITGLKNVKREDKIKESGITLDDIKLNVPAEEGGSMMVPGVFE